MVKFVETESRMEVSRSGGRGRGRGLVFNGDPASVLQDDLDMDARQCECTLLHWMLRNG